MLAVYRIAQEAMTNIARHAEASHAWVDVVPAGPYVRLRVADDGVGPPRGSPRRGSGLLGIDERVSAPRRALVDHRAARGRHHGRRYLPRPPRGEP